MLALVVQKERTFLLRETREVSVLALMIVDQINRGDDAFKTSIE